MATPIWFVEEFYLGSKLAQLQADPDPATASEWADKTAADVKAAIEKVGMTTFDHFEMFHSAEGTSPNQYFDTNTYLAAKAQALNAADSNANWTPASVLKAITDAGMNVYEHYNLFGASEGVNPSNAFDVSSYYDAKLAALQADPATASAWADKTAADVKDAIAEAGMTPVEHFLRFGQDEGLSAIEVPASERPSVGGDSFTLTKGLEDLDIANAAKAAFLAEVDGDNDPDTSATEAQVATALTTAETDTDTAVVAISAKSATDDIAYTANAYANASEAVQAAIVADTQEGAAALLATAQEKLAEAQADVDAVAGLTAAQESVDAAQDVADAATKAEILAGNAFTAASADFVSLNSLVTDTLDSATGAGTYVLQTGAVTLIEYDADAEAFVLADGITEEDYEGVTAVLNAVNADAVAIAASDAADEALLNAQLERNYLDLDAAAEQDLADIAAAFQVTELGTDEMPTLAEIQTEISILEGLRDALNTALSDAVDDAAVDTLLAAAVTDGILNTDDVTEITAVYDTAVGSGTHADGIAAAKNALGDYNTLDRVASDYTGAVDGLQKEVDDFVDFTDSAAGTTSETNDLTDALTSAQNAITNTSGTGIQDLIDDLNEALADEAEAQANVDTLADLNDAIDAAEQAFEDNGFAVPTTIDAANEYATSGDDVFVLGTIAGNTANVLNFGLLGDDKIFIGTDYVLNEGALATDGDNSVLEVFLTEVGGNATITVEQEAFGSNSADAETVITLTGVALEDITFADGFISLV